MILTDKKTLDVCWFLFALESHVSNVTVIVSPLFRFSLSSLSAEPLDCVNRLAYLCTAHKEKAPFEHIQREHGVCRTQTDNNSGERDRG